MIDVLFPNDPELRDSIGTRVGFDLLKASGPMTGYESHLAKINSGVDGAENEEDEKRLALTGALDAIAKDDIDGFSPNLTHGSLGLKKHPKAM